MNTFADRKSAVFIQHRFSRRLSVRELASGFKVLSRKDNNIIVERECKKDSILYQFSEVQEVAMIESP